MGSGVSVTVGVGLCSNVGDGLAVGVASGAAIWPEPRRIRKIIPPPIASTMKRAPIAKGKLKVISGSRWVRTALIFLVSVDIVNVLPHTKHLLALSPKRVPQVGHIFDLLFSGLIL